MTTYRDASLTIVSLTCLQHPLALGCSAAAIFLLFLSLLAACAVLLRRLRRLEGRALPNVLTIRPTLDTGPKDHAGILRSAAGAAMRNGRSSAVLVAGLDRFATFVGAHGPCAGDEALSELGRRLTAHTVSGTWVRVGGDLFALALEVIDGPEQAEAAALAVLRSLAPPISIQERGVSCTASVGLAVLPRDARDVDGGLRAAQAALARARTEGSNRLRVFDQRRDGARLVRDELAAELPDAIAAGAILPFYQPIVDLRSGSLVGLEVLARWLHATRGLLSPDAFMSAADEARLSGPITEVLMRRAVLDARVWPSRLFFSFNISPEQLGEFAGRDGSQDFPGWPEWTLDPTRLEIEVTECGTIQDLGAARREFAAWQARGTRLVLDDFGAGASNLARLRDIKFDKFKIDKGFLESAPTNPRADACVRAMLDLGARLGVEAVVEGLADADSARQVAAMGCRYGQGYFYSAPLPAGDVPALVRRMAPALPAKLIA